MITESPNVILCKLLPVSVADVGLPEHTSSGVLHNVTLRSEFLGEEQLEHGTTSPF
jgi:hypothetical protein